MNLSMKQNQGHREQIGGCQGGGGWGGTEWEVGLAEGTFIYRLDK